MIVRVWSASMICSSNVKICLYCRLKTNQTTFDVVCAKFRSLNPAFGFIAGSRHDEAGTCGAGSKGGAGVGSTGRPDSAGGTDSLVRLPALSMRWDRASVLAWKHQSTLLEEKAMSTSHRITLLTSATGEARTRCIVRCIMLLHDVQGTRGSFVPSLSMSRIGRCRGER